MKSYETVSGKRIELYIEPKTSHIKLKFWQGGELPEELTGMYTSEKDAERDILIYLEKNKTARQKAK